MSDKAWSFDFMFTSFTCKWHLLSEVEIWLIEGSDLMLSIFVTVSVNFFFLRSWKSGHFFSAQFIAHVAFCCNWVSIVHFHSFSLSFAQTLTSICLTKVAVCLRCLHTSNVLWDSVKDSSVFLWFKKKQNIMFEYNKFLLKHKIFLWLRNCATRSSFVHILT